MCADLCGAVAEIATAERQFCAVSSDDGIDLERAVKAL